MFYALDTEYRFTYINYRALNVWGKSAEELLGRYAWDPFPEAIDTPSYFAILDTMRHRRPVRIETPSPLRNRWIELNVYPSDDGGVLVYFRDIHDRKHAQDEMQRSREDLQFAITAAHLGTFYCEFPLDKIIWNETCKEHFFVEVDADVDIALFYSRLHPDDVEPTRAAIDRAMTDRVEYNVEYRVCGPQGQMRWVNAVGRFFYDEDGSPVRFDGITTDITHRKLADEELRTRARQEALLGRIAQEVRSALHPDAVQETAVKLLGQAFGVDRCFYAVYDSLRDRISCYQDYHAPHLAPIAGDYRLSEYRSVVERLFRDGTAVFSDTHEIADPDIVGWLETFGQRSILAVPLHSADVFTAALFVTMSQPRAWTHAEIALVEQVATMTRTAIESARVAQKEHAIAERLQAALQPALPENVAGLDMAQHYRPALDEAEVGGDFADVFPKDKGATYFVVGDLAGKGLAAASQVATVRNILRYVLYTSATLADAVESANRTVAAYEMLLGFATLFIGCFDAFSRTLTYVNCGQEAGVLVRRSTPDSAGGAVELLAPTGPVIGMSESAHFDEREVRLQPGDVLAVFTDGVTEIGPKRSELLGNEGFCKMLAAHAGLDGAREILDAVVAEVNDFAGSVVRDDQCVLVAVVKE